MHDAEVDDDRIGIEGAKALAEAMLKDRVLVMLKVCTIIPIHPCK